MKVLVLNAGSSSVKYRVIDPDAGTVTLGGGAMASVAMTGLQGSPVTDASGHYTATVPLLWSGTVTPTLAGYLFTPVSRTYANLQSDQTNQEYTASVGHALAVIKAGAGTGTVTSSPVRISCGTTCAALFPSGSSVTLSASPLAGSTFTGWAGEGCSGTGTCHVSMTQARSVTATFLVSACVQTVSNQTVTTTQTFTSCGLLTAGPAFRIASPGDVTFRAANAVILSNGFSVGHGVKFKAGLDPLLARP